MAKLPGVAKVFPNRAEAQAAAATQLLETDILPLVEGRASVRRRRRDGQLETLCTDGRWRVWVTYHPAGEGIA